jgi:hypothetical protein
MDLVSIGYIRPATRIDYSDFMSRIDEFGRLCRARPVEVEGAYPYKLTEKARLELLAELNRLGIVGCDVVLTSTNRIDLVRLPGSPTSNF